MDGTIIQQGTFISDGNARLVTLRSGIDWIEMYNYTTLGTNPNPGVVQRAFWQSDIGAGGGIGVYNTAGAATLEYAGLAVPNGFTVYDSSTATVGAAIAVTAGTNATQPVYSTGNTGALANGGIVRIVSTAHINLNGLDFSVDTLVANTSFRLANTLATAPGIVAGANGFWRLVAEDINLYKLFYPSMRYIANITQAANAVVTTLVDHAYNPGDLVRFYVSDAVHGMVEMDGLLGTITATTASTFTVNINSTGFTAFVFPTIYAVPYQHAYVVPVGEDLTQPYLPLGATRNQGIVAIRFGASVCGANNDVIYWRAGKVFNK